MSRAIQLGMNGIEHAAIRSVDLEAWRVVTASDGDQIRANSSVTQREALVWRHVDLDAAPVRALVAELATAGVFFDPVLAADEYDTLFLYAVEAEHPNNRYLPRSFVAANLGPEHDVFKVPSEMREVAEEGLVKRRQFVGMSHRAGVSIIAGTDGPGIGTLAAGFGLHRELELLVEAGLPPLEALRAATLNAARALRQDTVLGTIEPGKLADLVLLTRDPLADIRHSRSIAAVVHDGRVLDRATLDTILDRLERQAGHER